MKNLFTVLLISVFAVNASTQNLHKGLPLVKTSSSRADIRIGEHFIKGAWPISPDIERDSLPFTCYNSKELFTFYTDQDSISFDVKAGSVHEFYVLLNDSAYALTAIVGKAMETYTPEYDLAPRNKDFAFWYEQNKDNEYLTLLRTKYRIQEMIKGLNSDSEKALKIMNWVHNLWEHDGYSEPEKEDALYILEEVEKGRNFRCVEYGVVTSACLKSIGLKARTVGLKTKDLETRKSGAGHVVLEVFLNDLGKWVMLDPQFDVMPFLDDRPLNAVEFQKAIFQDFANLKIKSLTSNGIPKRFYVDWIYPYLYYFDIGFDNREGFNHQVEEILGKRRLMLVPKGAKNPKVFQGSFPLDFYHYTNSLNDFYVPPGKG